MLATVGIHHRHMKMKIIFNYTQEKTTCQNQEVKKNRCSMVPPLKQTTYHVEGAGAQYGSQNRQLRYSQTNNSEYSVGIRLPKVAVWVGVLRLAGQANRVDLAKPKIAGESGTQAAAVRRHPDLTD
jgi:hypothetical protein